MTTYRRARLLAVLASFALLVAACGDDDGGGEDADGSSGTTTDEAATTTTAPAEPLSILVANDDGIEAEGIDVLVEALVALDDVEVTVVAPAEQQSGTGNQTTEGELVTEETTTASGYPAVAVEGFPADAVSFGLDEVLDADPDVVITGINEGQNIGGVIPLSGTVGSAREAAGRGIPALASSQGLADPPDYESGVEAVLAWLDENRADLEAGTADAVVNNLNIPSCEVGEVRGVVEVEAYPDTDKPQEAPDCTSTVEDPADDLDAFAVGFATLSVLEPDLPGFDVPDFG